MILNLGILNVNWRWPRKPFMCSIYILHISKINLNIKLLTDIYFTKVGSQKTYKQISYSDVNFKKFDSCYNLEIRKIFLIERFSE